MANNPSVHTMPWEFEPHECPSEQGQPRLCRPAGAARRCRPREIARPTAPQTIFADVIANEDNLVRVWRFSNADQSWNFYDPRPAFESANTLEKSGAGDIVWVNVTAEQAFQGGTLFPGWNLISLK